ncbi:entericidin [Rhizobium panacihumi]|uniref:entericidin domain-containing protein n=1 Tax=Rhizobium panacihumi TaxID=2008450 RepID=UPI003D78F92F
MTKSFTIVIAMAVMTMGLAACGNTIRGVGQDAANTVNATQNAGKRIDRAVRY